MFDTGKNISYEYDSLNRLTKETNLAIGSEWRYTYDNGGNITRKEEYNPSTGALVSSRDYGYGHSYWKDQLTSWGSYGTNYFAYDSSGNPTKYKGKTLTWEGKRLTKYSASSTSNMDLSYDGSGMLIGYIQSDTYTDWAGAQYTNVYSREMTRDGDRILTEKVTSIDGALLTNEVKNVKYMYDAKGASGMIVDGTKYYFRKNIFGDVVEIYNESGAKCAEYTYDAWGTCYLMLDTEGVGSLNPFRYRGYYFVSRIGLYYLTTRFYDYTTGRFINADVPSICFDDGLTLPEGCNLYSYCRNNPIMNVDPSGHFGILALIAITVASMVIGGGAQLISNAVAGKTGSELWRGVVGAAIGAGVNALALCLAMPTGGASLFIAAGASSIAQTGVDTLETVIRGEQVDWAQTAIDLGLNFATTLAGNYLGGKIVPTNPGWFQPKKFLSVFTKSYGQKILLQTTVGAGLSGAVNLARKNDWSEFVPIISMSEVLCLLF